MKHIIMLKDIQTFLIYPRICNLLRGGIFFLFHLFHGKRTLISPFLQYSKEKTFSFQQMWIESECGSFMFWRFCHHDDPALIHIYVNIFHIVNDDYTIDDIFFFLILT